MVPGDKDDAGGCPDKDKHDPEHGAEGRLMVILYSNSQSLFCFLLKLKCLRLISIEQLCKIFGMNLYILFLSTVR